MGLLESLNPAAKAVAEQLKNADASDAIPAGFAEAIATIEARGVGMPPIGGAAVAPYAKLKGFTDGAHGYAGHGPAAGFPMFDTVQAFLDFAAEIRAETPQASPPDAPPSVPALAADPVPGDVPPQVAAANEALSAPSVAAVPPPTVQDPTPAPPASSDAAPQADTVVLMADCSKMTTNELRALVTALQSERTSGAPAVAPVAASSEPSSASAGVRVYVNARPSSPAESLNGYLDDVCRALAGQCKVVDIRAA
jgi:hypothetical protein